jgi:uncharacterized surface protein with fasciclin (FAS1) repeats
MRTSLMRLIAVPAVAFTFAVALAFPPPTVVGGGDKDKPAEQPKPAEGKNLLETLKADANFSTFVELLTTAGMADDLKRGDHTVFAPTNDAFKALPAGKLDDWKKPANKVALKQTLQHHIVRGKKMAADLKDGSTLTAMHGDLKVSNKAGKVMVGDATVSKADTAASNGVIHTIDKVQMVEAASPSDKGEPTKKPPVGT